jgi:hypothetical protein
MFQRSQFPAAAFPASLIRRAPIIFYLFQPSFGFIRLHLPSLAFIGEGSERGVGGVFSLFRPHGLRWLEPTEASAVACGYGGRVAGVEIDCAYVSHVIITRLGLIGPD